MCVKLTVWHVLKDCQEMEIIQPLGRMNVLSKIHGNITIDLKGKFWFDSGARRTKEDACSSHFFFSYPVMNVLGTGFSYNVDWTNG